MKKTRYSVRIVCLLAAVGVSLFANAQEDKKKEQDLNRQLTLEREYDPSVQDANKVSTLPVVKEPEVRKIPIDYSDYTLAMDPEQQISVLPSGNILTQMDYNKRRGYLRLGAGTFMNLNGDFGYHALSTDRDQLSISFSHRSANGNVKYIQLEDAKVKAKINDNLGGITYGHTFDKAILNLKLNYGYSAFNYYGYHDALEHWTNSSFAYVIPAQEGFDRETNQVNQTIAASLGIESKEGADLAYLVDLGFVNFSHKYGISKETDGPKENTFEAKFDVSKGFNDNMRFGLGGLVEYFNYSLPAEKTMSDGSLYCCEFENHAEVMLSPYYKVGGENWNVKLGANVMLKTGEEDLFMASPNVAIHAEVADKTELYLNANGKLYSNSMYEMSKINRYLDPTRELRPSRNWLDAIVGIKSGVAPGFWFDVFAGYKMTSDDVLFVPQFSDLKDGFGNFSQAMDNINTTLLFVGANLKYSYQQLFELSLKGVYNSWKAKYGDDWIGVGDNKELAHAWGKPEMELNAGITVRPIDKLAVALDYYLATGRYTQLYGTYEYKMNNINELNLTATYTLNDTFGFYVKANNLLAQKYELYYGYPMQRLSAQVGVNINF